MTFTSCQNAACSHKFFLCWVDYALEGSTFSLGKCDFSPLFLACSRLRDGGGKSFSNKKCEKRARAWERQGGGACMHFLTACSGISAPDIPSDWSIVTVNIIT